VKITDVSVTLFTWDGIPATRYARQTGQFEGSSTLGLVTVHTDDGVDGHAFLGSASNGADREGPIVTKVLNPC
jgi:hypothetical protein|tara:strand:- start:491 stop:709 length:219 start_codon:yes stop_codon:yes gene_type:complete